MHPVFAIFIVDKVIHSRPFQLKLGHHIFHHPISQSLAGKFVVCLTPAHLLDGKSSIPKILLLYAYHLRWRYRDANFRPVPPLLFKINQKQLALEAAILEPTI